MPLFLIHTYAFIYRNAIFAKRNIFFVAEMIFWPTMGILSIGLMGGFLNLDHRALAFVLTGAVASGVLQVTQLDVGYSLLYDVWSKSVKHTFLSPASMAATLLGSWAVGIFRGLAVFAFLAALARYSFDFHLPAFLPTAAFLFGIFYVALLSGMLVWILILLYGQRAEITVWALSYLLMVLCGIYYPVNLLPEPFLTFAKLVPLTYFLDDVRTLYGFSPLFEHAVLKGWALNFIYTIVGYGLLQKALGRAYATGQLVRLSE